MKTPRWSPVVVSLWFFLPASAAPSSEAAARGNLLLGTVVLSQPETTPEGSGRTRLELLVEWTPDSQIRSRTTVLLREAARFESGEPVEVLVGAIAGPGPIYGIRRLDDPARKVYPTEFAVSGAPSFVVRAVKSWRASPLIAKAGVNVPDAHEPSASPMTMAPSVPSAPVPPSPPVRDPPRAPDPTCGTADTRPPASCLIAYADLDRDGIRDLVLVRPDGTRIVVLLGDGRGGFLPAREIVSEFKPSCVTVGDLDGDGRPDLALADRSRGVSIMAGDGKGGFKAIAEVAMDGSPRLVTAAPLLGNEKSDLVVAVCEKNGEFSLALYTADGGGGFAQRWSIPMESRADALVVDDFDHDGMLDLAELSTTKGTAKPHNGALLRSP